MVTVMRAMATGMGLALMLALPAAGQAVPHARVAQGELAGTIDHGAQAFLNIPFGAAPVGDRRWAAPLPPPAWSGVRDAGKFRPACMQQDARPQAPWSIEYFVLPPYSEDCLNLNVWTTGGSGKAVVLFIPGGGFTQGGGAVPVYNGSGMAKAGVVAVTMNYRLSAAGFLTHPELDAAAGHSGDYALMDVIAALTWIRQNIAAFGGDPAKVTVMGQSAGAAAIVALLHSPLASGLFRAAIIDSGVRAGRGAPTSAEREAVTKEWAASKGAATLAQMRRDLRTGQPVVAAGLPAEQPVDAGRGLHRLQAERREIRLAAGGEGRHVARLATLAIDDLDAVAGKEMQDDGAVAENAIMLDAGVQSRQARLSNADLWCRCRP